MSDIASSAGRVGLPDFVFVANEGPPSLAERLAGWLHRAAPKPALETQEIPEAEPPVALERRPRRVFGAALCACFAFVATLFRRLRPLAKGVRTSARAAWRAMRALGCGAGWTGRRIWRIYRAFPATGLGLTGGLLFAGIASIPILGARPPALQTVEAVDAGARGRNAWVSIIRPAHLYSLDMPDLDRAPQVYAARRFGRTGERRDTLTFGAFGAPDLPWLRLHLHRHPPGAEDFQSSASRQIRQAALETQDGIEPSGKIATRFGPMEIARLTLSPRDHEAAHETSQDDALACLAFRIDIGEPALLIEGLSCETPGRIIGTEAVGCMIDRLDLQAGASDESLRDFFARSEGGRRRECGRLGAGRSPETGEPAGHRRPGRTAGQTENSPSGRNISGT